MKRLAGWLLSLALLCGWAGAQNPGRLPPSDQARLLSRNRALLQATVAGSLELADSDSALERADSCQRLVRVWLREVEAAARSGDVSRAVEMGDYMSKLADRGVASNLRAARKQIPPSTVEERQLLQRRDEAVRDLEQIEGVLTELARSQSDLKALLDQVQSVRRIVAAAADSPKP
ncbi:MAG: hypothetical protein N2039_14210 [Gemmataceae bacterium]|nr:hypothetical protein [Gemmataceae bacterium]